MQPHTTAEAAVLASGDYSTQAKLYVSRKPQGVQGTLTDTAGIFGEEVFLNATINADLEEPISSADIYVHLGMGSKNASPFMSGPTWSDGLPLFWPGVYVSLYTRCLNPLVAGDELIPFRPTWVGRIDACDPAEDQEDALKLECRDVFSDLLTRWIKPQGAGDPHLMPAMNIQALLLELLELGMGGLILPGLDFDTIGTAHMAIVSYPQEPMPILLAMRAVALQNGWDLRPRFDNTEQLVLTYYEPDRSLSGPSTRLTADRYERLGRLRLTREEVRNYIEVVPANPPRTPVVLKDDDSINLYGEAYMRLSEDVGSLIHTQEQAVVLCAAILSDCKDPKVTAEVHQGFHPFVEINDVLHLTANNVHLADSLIVAVSGYTKTLNRNGSGSTVIRTRDRPAAANSEWRAGTPRMDYWSTNLPTGPAKQGAVWTVT